MSKKFLQLLLSAWMLQHPLYSDEEECCFEEEYCGCAGQPYRIEASHIEGNGLGYKKGYSSLGGFIAPFNNCSIVPFLDLRGHIFNDGKLAANAGVGARYQLGTWIYGVNTYYDYRKTSHLHYNQIGLGCEVLGPRWEFRVNGYIPVGKKVSGPFRGKSFSNLVFDSFSGHEMLISIMTRSKNEFAMKGVDAEVGALILKKKHYDAFFGIGPYYYSGEFGKHTTGGRARLTVNAFEYILLECIGTIDSLFHEIVQGRIGINIPFGPRKSASTSIDVCRCWKALALNKKLFQDVQRQEIVVLKNHRKRELTQVGSVAINPVTSQPYHFIFVDNTSSSQGTFESPFPTLKEAQFASHMNDIIYVFPGDGTDKGMNVGIDLKDNQRLLGSSTPYLFQTTLGGVTVPPLSTTKPVISNTGALVSVVEMADNCETSGLMINAVYPPTLGLFPGVNADGPTNALISFNTINSASDGIDVTNYEGIIDIRDNTITGVPVAFNFSDCIAVFSPTSQNNIVTITRNILSNNDQSGIHIANISSKNQIAALILNTITNCQEGCLLENDGGGIQSTLADNNITATTNNGTNQPAGVFIHEFNVAQPLCATLTGNIATTLSPIPGYCYFNESPLPTNLPLILDLTNIGSILTLPGSFPINPQAPGTCQ